MTTLVIDARFNGPPDSANGGYTCGVVSSVLGSPAIATLRKPPPLERPLVLEARDEQFVLREGETVVAEALAEELGLEPPEPPSFEEAVEAAERFPAYETHIFPTCFVCGPGRPKDDGMNIFPGPITERGVVASPWTPDASIPNDRKRIADEIVWAALDCTSFFPHYPVPAVLGRLHGKLLEETRVGERYIAVGWKLGSEDRKLWSGSAIFDEDGQPCAIAKATWIALKNKQQDFKVAR